MALVLALPLLAVGAITWLDSLEGEPLRQAARRLEAGELETAQRLVREVAGRPRLTFAGRRKAAVLLCRLGEDQAAQKLLIGLRADPEDPADLQLRHLGARCQAAAGFLRRADQSRDPAARLALARQARDELPDAPRVLQRVVMEEMLALALPQAPPELSRAFELDYTDLRRRAPSLAAAIRSELRKRLGAIPPSKDAPPDPPKAQPGDARM